MNCVFAFGKSQLGAFMRGHKLLRARDDINYELQSLGFWEERYQPLVQYDPRRVRYNPVLLQDIRDAIRRLNPVCLVASLLGAEHYLHGVINDPRPFDFLLPGHPQYELSPDTELIPYHMIERRFRGDLNWQFDIVRSIREYFDLPIYHIEAPPPVKNAELIAKRVYGQFRDRMNELGCPTVSFRYKVWWLYSYAAKDICAELNVTFIDGPPESRDASGFLAEKYFLDGVHATDEYGAMITREVAIAMKRSGLLGG